MISETLRPHISPLICHIFLFVHQLSRYVTRAVKICIGFSPVYENLSILGNIMYEVSFAITKTPSVTGSLLETRRCFIIGGFTVIMFRRRPYIPAKEGDLLALVLQEDYRSRFTDMDVIVVDQIIIYINRERPQMDGHGH